MQKNVSTPRASGFGYINSIQQANATFWFSPISFSAYNIKVYKSKHNFRQFILYAYIWGKGK